MLGHGGEGSKVLLPFEFGVYGYLKRHRFKMHQDKKLLFGKLHEYYSSYMKVEFSLKFLLFMSCKPETFPNK
jgi:hypothetical protein